MDIIITKEMEGLCLREIIHRELEVSVKMLKYLKYRNEGILVNGERRTVRFIPQVGDVLTLETEDRTAQVLDAVDLPISVLYEDADIVVPNKPADMPTHPSHNHHGDTVANALAFRYQTAGVPFVFRPINRLDRNTSGLLLIARNKIAAGKLAKQMQAGEIRKAYLAVLDGEWQEERGTIDAPLHRTQESIIVREVCSPDAPDADSAKTEFEVLARENGHTLVMARPITGRTHQLRVHFAHKGHPITGDDLYGTEHNAIPRHALHARRLEFRHPTNGKSLALTAPLPDDLKSLILTCFPQFCKADPTILS